MCTEIQQIALSLLQGIGPKRAKQLVAHIGSVEGVFEASPTSISEISGIGLHTALQLNREAALSRAAVELDFIKKNNIRIHFYTDSSYPKNLSQCPDAPIVLYSKGQLTFNQTKNIAIVGTRKASNYGKQLVKDFLHDLQDFDIQIVSGLAFGIDIQAHRMALEFNLPTIGVLAHGLDQVYPLAHQSTAKAMEAQGGLVSEFISETRPDKENFPKRNRIVAGICDATIIVESAEKGGSLITAGLANDYHRDVFAFPGNVNQLGSKGCNRLIQKNRAHLITSAQDFIETMGWENQALNATVQTSLFDSLSHEEEIIIQTLKEFTTLHINAISNHCEQPIHQTTIQLFNLEMKGLIRMLPGKRYELTS